MAINPVNINNPQELKKVIADIDEYLKTVVKQKRYEHSVRTAQTAAHMCSLYGLNPDIGYLAGIAHDMCKEISDEEMLDLASSDGMVITDLEKEKTSLLHGRAAAVLITKKFGVEDKDVVQAIAFHTFAARDLCDLGKILFVADKIEPGRPQSTEEYRAGLFAKSLDELTLSVLLENIEYLEKRGKVAAPASFELCRQLQERIKE